MRKELRTARGSRSGGPTLRVTKARRGTDYCKERGIVIFCPDDGKQPSLAEREGVSGRGEEGRSTGEIISNHMPRPPSCTASSLFTLCSILIELNGLKPGILLIHSVKGAMSIDRGHGHGRQPQLYEAPSFLVP